MRNNIKSKVIVTVLACLMFFALGVFNYGTTARADTTITNGEELNAILTKLSATQVSVARETCIIIDGLEDIDYGEYEHLPINLSNEKFEDRDLSITFNVGVKNVWHKSEENWVDNWEHYGLFSNVTHGYVPISYKVTFDGGNGVVSGAPSYYTYGTGISAMPTVSTSDGSSFVKWVLEGDETESAVTSISSSEWGVKSYVAVYESAVVPDPTPTTYDIVYTDTTLGTSVDGQENIYVDGESLALGQLSIAGFIFKGWEVNGSGNVTMELPDTLPEGYLSSEGKIELNAVWELENPTIGNLNGIDKVYDGVESSIGAEVSHTILEEVAISYTWLRAESEEDMLSPTTIYGTSQLSFKLPTECYYKVKLKATHATSGLESEFVESEWVKVEIRKASVQVVQVENCVVEKTYDGSVDASLNVSMGVHYDLVGVIDGDNISVNITSATFDGASVGSHKVEIVFSSLSYEDASLESAYDFCSTTIEVDGLIISKQATFSKLSSPVVTKPYDGTTEVTHNFVNGVDYLVEGLEEGVDYTVSAIYDDKNVGARVVTLALELKNSDYNLNVNAIEYDGEITPVAIVPNKGEDLMLTKVYDGTRKVNYQLEYGVDFVLQGAVQGEVQGVEYSMSYDLASVDATAVCVVFGDLILSDGASLDNYQYQSGYYEFYYTGSITPCIIDVSPKNIQKVYGDEDALEDIVTSNIGDSIAIKYLRQSGESVGEYDFTGTEMVEVNANYSLNFIANENKFTIIPRVPDLVFPTFESVTYNPSLTLNDLEVSGENYNIDGEQYIIDLGKFYWLDGSQTPVVDNGSGYIMVFLPNDKENYDYTGLEGYSAQGEMVIRNVGVTVLPALPTPTEMEDRFELSIGSLWDNLKLPQGWKIVNEDNLLGLLVFGQVGETLTYEDRLEYRQDESSNYLPVYKDLVVDVVKPIVAYTYNGEKVYSATETIVDTTSSVEPQISFVLENPFDKAGYWVEKWTLDGSEIINENNSLIGATFIIDDANLIKKEIILEVSYKARTDVKITYEHFYEKVEGGFNEVAEQRIELFDGEADAIRSIEESDIIEILGFAFVGAKIGGEEFKSEFTVSPYGDDIVRLYYERKMVNITFASDRYSHLNPQGSLPSGSVVKYGKTISLPAPNDFILYGYSYEGYTDDLTFEDDMLKVFNENYTVDKYLPNLVLNLVMKPNDNVGYLVIKHLDGEETTEIRYGRTGERIDLTNEAEEGYKRVDNLNQVLYGDISGYLEDTNGVIIGGQRLELHLYYERKEEYVVELDDSLGMDDFTAYAGEEILLPSAPDIMPEGMRFGGWSINGEVYMAGANFVMPEGDVRIEPIWESAEEGGESNSSDLNAEVEDDGVGAGGIVGIALGSLALLGGLIGISVVVKKKNKDREMIIGRMQARRRNNSKK